MAAKKKGHTRHHNHQHAKKGHGRQKNPSAGAMVLVPASMVPQVENPAKKHPQRSHPKRHHHHPRRRNPAEGEHPQLKQGASAVGFGALAAFAGLAGGFALTKANLRSKFANVAANAAAAAAIGGALGMLDRIAGTVVAHNYMVAAGQFLMADPNAPPAVTQRRILASMPVMPPQHQAAAMPAATPSMFRTPVRPLRGPDEMEGVVADNFASAEDVDGYEKLEGVVADTMSGPEELEGIVADTMAGPDELDGYERLEGIVADDMGDSEELGEEEIGDADDVGDPDLYG